MEFLTTSGLGDNRGKRFFGTTLFSQQPEVARTSAMARWKALVPYSKTSAGTTPFSWQPEVARTSTIARWKALGPYSKTSAGVGVSRLITR